MTEIVTIGLAALAAGGQAWNVYLKLRIRNDILESQRELRHETDQKLKDYVLEKTCNARLAQHARPYY